MTELLQDLPTEARRRTHLRSVHSTETGDDTSRVADLSAIRHSISRRRREAARIRALSQLMAHRAELVGVHSPADLVVEAARWSV